MPTEGCLKSRHSRARKKRGDGQVTVEFALICIPFFAILFAIIDYAQIYFYENSLQNAMREAARFGTAGRVIEQYYPNGSVVYETNAGVVVPKAILDSQGREASRNECIRYWFLSNCEFVVPITNITISSASTLAGVPPTTTTNSVGQLVLLSSDGSPAAKGPGAANDYMQITATMTVNTITPLMSYLGAGYSHGNSFKYPVKVSAIVKNEPALLNFSHTNMYSDEP